MTIFVRVLEIPVTEKGESLRQAIEAYNERRKPPDGVGIYERDPSEFRALPTTPFAYWADEAVFHAFQTLPPLDPGFDKAPDLVRRLADAKATLAQRRKALRDLNAMLRRAWSFLTAEERVRLSDVLSRLINQPRPAVLETPPKDLLAETESQLRNRRTDLAAAYAEAVVPTLLRYQTATAKQGLATADDFRFVRAWWEVDPETIGYSPEDTRKGRGWVHFAKGGAFSPFYADVHLVVDWWENGQALRDFSNAYIRNKLWYFRPGLTWPNSTTSDLSVRVFPMACIFGHMGPSLFAWQDDGLALSLLALLNSRAYMLLLGFSLGLATAGRRHYEVGLLQRTPIPHLGEEAREDLAALGKQGFHLQREADRADETTHVFTLPALALAAARRGQHPPLPLPHVLAEQARQDEAERRAALVSLQREIDDFANALYGMKVSSNAEEKYAGPLPDDATLSADFLMWAVGVAFGRWDIRLALEARLPELPAPFAPLSRYAPAALRTARGEPFPPFEDDPSDLPAQGLLADDPGQPWDLTGRVRRVLRLLWGDQAPAAETELLHMLGTDDLRAWLHHPNEFWRHHRTRYSKSRRKAPIYWPLQSERRAYTIWLYYPRLDRDMVFKALDELALPRLNRLRSALADLRAQAAGNPPADLRRRLAVQEAAVAELQDFYEELKAVADLNIVPSLDDGVLLNAAPYHELLPWPDAVRAWRELQDGKYPWSGIAKFARKR